MGTTGRTLLGMLVGVLVCTAAHPAEAALFGRRFRHKMVRTFEPLNRLKEVRKVRHIRDGFVDEDSPRSRTRHRTYRRHRTVRHRGYRHRTARRH